MNGAKDLDLPISWTSAPLREIADINPKIDKSGYADDSQHSFVPMTAVEAETGLIDLSETRRFGALKKGYTGFRERDVLFAKITPCMENGKMAVVPPIKNDLGFGSTEFHVLRPREGICAEYIYYFVSSQKFRSDAEHNMTGAVGQRRVPASYLAQHPIPLAPGKLQHRIVAKIRELFSELEKAVEVLETARDQLRVYRQAVLKQAFDGKLTEPWRHENETTLDSVELTLARIKQQREAGYRLQLEEWKTALHQWDKTKLGSKPSKPESVRYVAPHGRSKELEYDIPDAWSLTSVNDVSIRIVDCLHSTPKFVLEGWACIDSTCIENNKVLINDLRFVDRATFVDRIQRLKPRLGDVLLVREGSKKIGTSLVVDFDREFCLGQRMMLFRLPPCINPHFFCYYIQSVHFKRQYKPLIGGSASPHLNITDIKAMVFPYCSEAEQAQVVALIDQKISLAEKVESEITEQIKKSAMLREAILEKAYSGQLVSGHKTDELASVLLQRIKAQSEERCIKKRKAAA
jgi:type I restriction enzyme S subunit